MRWLRLNDSNLDSIPTAVNRLLKLEHLYVDSNKLLCIPPSIRNLTNLRAFRAAYNDLAEEDICGDLFGLHELAIVDLSHNSMSALPSSVPGAKSLVALSVGHNKIEEFDPSVCKSCKDMELLDLSHNKLSFIPGELRNMTGLRTLLISDNPLDTDNQLSGVFALVGLEHLEMAATNRTNENIPLDIVKLRRLHILDLSRNPLGRFPEQILGLGALERLNLSDCGLAELPSGITDLDKLYFLNLSRNNLTTLPVNVFAREEEKVSQP